MAEECFKIDGVAIAAPETYKPVFSTTSTKSTKRDQTLTMHNSVSDCGSSDRSAAFVCISDCRYNIAIYISGSLHCSNLDYL